jgi:hypothetical protein
VDAHVAVEGGAVEAEVDGEGDGGPGGIAGAAVEAGLWVQLTRRSRSG